MAKSLVTSKHISHAQNSVFNHTGSIRTSPRLGLALILATTLSLSSSPAWSVDHTRATPCPFINTLIQKGLIDSDHPTVEELGEAAAKYGINRTLMEKLASAVAEPESRVVLLSKLLEAGRRPAHLGSLARADGKLGTVDAQRLDSLKNYSSDGKITFRQLQKYQKLCWNKTENGMGFVDKVISDGELQLLWGLFGAYREPVNGVDAISVDLVFDFLKDNTLPGSFMPNKKDPTTYWGLIGSILYSRVFGGN